MRTVLISIFSLLLTLSTARAQDSLPRELPLDFAAGPEFAPFEQEPGDHTSPVGSRITQDGRPVFSQEQLHAIFRDRFLARIPRGAAIETSLNAAGRPVWNYPVGTWLSHWIEWNAHESEPHSLFELRVSFKLARDRWEMVTYLPSPDGKKWVQRGADSNSPSVTHRFMSAVTQQPTEIQLNRIPQSSCRACHFNLSRGNESFESPNDAGPCGFAVGNTSAQTSWAESYLRQNGSVPFRAVP